MNSTKKVLLALLLTVSAFPLSAQDKTDTIYTFRFVQQDDMFYVPWRDNGTELTRLLECIESHKTDIMAGRSPLYVDGYCNTGNSERTSLAIAKKRSNRVKSELIVRKGLREENFITRNHFAEGNYVTVRIVLPKPAVPVAEDKQSDRNKETPQTLPKDNQVSGKTNDTEGTDNQQGQTPALSMLSKTPDISLRTNLLRWVTLTPDLGVEWRISNRWSLLLSGTWTSWSWDDKNRRYALWEVSPEVHYRLGAKKRGYIGAMFHTGQFNYKFSEKGKQGDLVGGGLTGGYILPLGSNLSLDFTIGVGCSHADFEKYRVIDGVRVKAGKETKDYWGVNSIGVSLVYNLKHGGNGR